VYLCRTRKNPISVFNQRVAQNVLSRATMFCPLAGRFWGLLMDATPSVDVESVMLGRSDLDGQGLRVWLRMASCVALMDEGIRRRLRADFNTTRPRFDFMAHLASAPQGLTLGELSRRMMVSNGNITGIAKRLIDDGLVQRQPHPQDKRVTLVALTGDGITAHAAMAAAHESCVDEMLSGLDEADREVLLTVLSLARESIKSRQDLQSED
jgi:DNA-binding MarR family transcriptional regulator